MATYADPPRMRSPGRGYGPPPPPIDRPSGRPYKVLCVSALHLKASDDVVRDTLYREYKKYGDISVRVIQEPDERVAYVYFRNFEDARDAKHSKSRIILFDKAAIVEPVYESRSEAPPPSSYQPRRRSITPPGPPGYPRYRSRSPGDYRASSGSRDDFSRSYDHHDRGGYAPRDHHSYPPRGDYQGGRGRGGYHPRGGYNQHHQPHYQPHHDGPRGRYEDRGGYQGGPKKDKFPNYLNHIAPEDDPLATRTLFAGNLELNITDEEMKRIFGRYGRLVDIDVKRPAPGTGNAYAFIRYENLDMAHRAKKELSGQYIGKFQCKIGYGKVNATTKVWVGGLGPWCSENLLWKEFDRFGSIKKIEYQKGDMQAHIFYEVIDAAQASVSEMRGFPLGGPDKRLRVDFADLDIPTGLTSRRVDTPYTGPPGPGARGPPGEGRGPPGGYNGDRGYGPPGQQRYGNDDWNSGRPGSMDRMQGRPRRSDSPESGQDMSPSRSNKGQDLAMARNVTEICRMTPKVWEGGLILKNSLFPTKLHLIEGNRRIAESLKDEQERTNLKITQRLRLDQNKLEDVSKRMSNSSSHAVFLGVTTNNTTITCDNPEVSNRPLRNLISYLKQKEAAGVISMTHNETDEMQQGVLYCFPPCEYSMDLLKREAPNVVDESNKDDHLLVVVVCGSHN